MKIAVLNYSGNVGKTTIARDLLKFNLQDYDLVSIESVNSDGKEEFVIRGDKGDAIFSKVLYDENVILDIGSSNLEIFLNHARADDEILEYIDIFIVPVTPEVKQQTDSIRIIRDLLKLGIKTNQIKVIFNQVPEDIEFDDIFDLFTEATQKKLGINIDKENIIFKHNLYSTGQTLPEMLSDEDFKKKMIVARDAGRDDEGRKYASEYIRQKKLHKLNDQYYNIFRRVTQK